jgi:hypothetical protein
VESVDMPTAVRRPAKFRLALSGGRNKVKPRFALQPVMDSTVLVSVAACCGTGFGTSSRARAAGWPCSRWVIRVGLAGPRRLPIYPSERTFSE